MAPGLRKLVLTAHIVSSVGWLGAVVGFLALSVAGLTSQDPRLVRGAYLAMDLIVRQVIVPLALASLLIGIVQALGTTWGLFRHYWVLVKLLVITAAIVVLLLQLEPITRGPRRRGPDRAPRADGAVRLQATRHDPLRSAQAGPGPPTSDSCPLTERAPGDPVSRLKREPAPSAGGATASRRAAPDTPARNAGTPRRRSCSARASRHETSTRLRSSGRRRCTPRAAAW